MTFIGPRDAAQPRILPDIMEHIGNTPMVRINQLGRQAGITCEIVAKCEFFNAGGSVKDRIVKAMLAEAERQGQLISGGDPRHPPTTIVEATSGNTGIALAMASAIKGLPCIIALPEKMSQEKVGVLRALGAQIHRTPTEAASSDPESNISVAARLVTQLRAEAGDPAAAFQPDQYANPNNPRAHYEGTGREIWEACEGKVDVAVMGAGTGGTITGVARYLRERNPNVLIVGVDPVGSILGGPDAKELIGRPYQVEGIGYDFIPEVLAPSLVDRWIKVDDRDAFQTARQLIRQEGLLCGGSSGAAMFAALQAARELQLGPDKRLVVILPDSVRNYMSKFLSDDWMLINGFMEPTDAMIGWAFNATATLHHLGNALQEVPVVADTTKGQEIMQLFTGEPDQPASRSSPTLVALRDQASTEIVGVVSKSRLEMLLLREGSAVLERGARRLMQKEFKVIPLQTRLKCAAALVATGFPVLLEEGRSPTTTTPCHRLRLLQAADLLRIHSKASKQ